MTPHTQNSPTIAPKQIDPSDYAYFRYLGPLAADKYAFTMAAALFEAERKGIIKDVFASETTFQMFVRQLPKTGMPGNDGENSRSAYLMTAGAFPLAEWLAGWHFSQKDIDVLREERAANGNRLYSDEFLHLLSRDTLQLQIDAMPDGELAFEREPIVRVTGPLYQCLMVEAMILGIYNSCSNAATLATQVVAAAQGRPVYEQGLRRAQDIGGLGPSYASFIGGVTGTSNYLARKHFGIPASGTMAHALVMVADNELEAFSIWAQGAPDIGVFLVDTYDTIEGVKNAITTCKKYGIKLNGVRLDSGDIGYLAKQARKLLDDAGFEDGKIFASNDLTPAKIDNLINQQKSPIDSFSCGTWLATAMANPALGGVYKLAARVNLAGIKEAVMKFSEDAGKATLPGVLDVLRIVKPDGNWGGDVIVAANDDELTQNGVQLDHTTGEVISINPQDTIRQKTFPAGSKVHRPVQPLWRDGAAVIDYADVKAAQARGKANLARLDDDHRRLVNPHRYIAGIEKGLHDDFTARLTQNAVRRDAHRQHNQYAKLGL